MFRHATAGELLARGADLDVVKELLGHASIRSTEAYLHPAPEAMRQAVERLGPLDFAGGSVSAVRAAHGSPPLGDADRLAMLSTCPDWSGSAGIPRPRASRPIRTIHFSATGLSRRRCGIEATAAREGSRAASRSRRERRGPRPRDLLRNNSPAGEWNEELCLVCRVTGATRPAADQGLCFSCDRLRRRRAAERVERIRGGDELPTGNTPTELRGLRRVVLRTCGSPRQRAVPTPRSGLASAGSPDLARFPAPRRPPGGPQRTDCASRASPERCHRAPLRHPGRARQGRKVAPTCVRSLHTCAARAKRALLRPVSSTERAPVRCSRASPWTRSVSPRRTSASEAAKGRVGPEGLRRHGRLSFVGGGTHSVHGGLRHGQSPRAG